MRKELLVSAKSAVHDALLAYEEEDDRTFLLNAAISAELLGKTLLSSIHPSLIVSPNSFDSLLHVCGASRHTTTPPSEIRTIGGKDVVNRCCQIVPTLKEYRTSLLLLSDIRNGLVHLGRYELSVQKKIEVQYFKYLLAMLNELGVTPEDFLERFEDTINSIVEESVSQSEIKVSRLIHDAKTYYEERFDGVDPAIKEMTIRNIVENIWLFEYEEERVECPACGNFAVVKGHSEFKEWDVEEDDEGIPNWFPIVELFTDEFECRACRLKLEGSEELDAAGIPSVIEIDNADPADFQDYSEYYDYRE